MSADHVAQTAPGDRVALKAATEAEEILQRIYTLPAAEQRRTVEFLRNHSDAGLRACAKPLEDALILRALCEGEK